MGLHLLLVDLTVALCLTELGAVGLLFEVTGEDWNGLIGSPSNGADVSSGFEEGSISYATLSL